MTKLLGECEWLLDRWTDLYKLVKDNSSLVVRYTEPAVQLIVAIAVLTTIALIYKSFSDQSALNGIWATSLFIVFPLMVLQSGTFVFDKSKRILSYRTRGPLFRLQSGQITFGDIQAVELECHHDSDGDGYRIVLRCEDNSFPLAKSFSAKAPLLECFKQVHETVLQRPPALEAYEPASILSIKGPTRKASADLIEISESTKLSVRQLVRDKKMIDAIKLVRHETGLDLKDAKHFVDNMSQQD